LALDSENIYDEEKQHDRENGTESEIELLPNRHQKSLHILTAGIPGKKTRLTSHREPAQGYPGVRVQWRCQYRLFRMLVHGMSYGPIASIRL